VVLLEQTTEDALTNSRDTWQEIGTGLGGQVVEISFRVWSQTNFGGNAIIRGNINCYRFSNYTGICDGETVNIVATSTNTLEESVDFPSSATSTLTFFFDDYNFGPSAYYTITAIGGGNNTQTYSSGSTSDVFALGACKAVVSCVPVVDLWFRIITQTISSGVIQIIEPTQATTTTTTTVDIEVDYFNSGNADVLTLFLWNRVTSQQVILPVFDFPINVGFDTATTTLDIAEGSYTLQAILVNSSTGTQFGSIVDVDFNVISDVVSEIFGVDIYDPDDLLFLATTTCSIFNITGCFQNAMIFVFIPSIESFDKFIELKDLVVRKPPFGYFALLVGGLSGINSTSTPAFTLATEDNITTNIFDPIRTGLTWLLWFGFGIWLYKRVKNLAL